MKFGVVVFPGSNCDHDAYHVISKVIGQPVELIRSGGRSKFENVSKDLLYIDFCTEWAAGTDGILIGRGAMQNPWIFRQFEDALAGREPYQPDLDEKKTVLLEFFEMCLEEMPEIVALGKMKQLAGQFTKGLPGGAQFRQTLYHSHSVQEILDNITIYFGSISNGSTFGDGLVESEADEDLEMTSCEAPVIPGVSRSAMQA